MLTSKKTFVQEVCSTIFNFSLMQEVGIATKTISAVQFRYDVLWNLIFLNVIVFSFKFRLFFFLNKILDDDLCFREFWKEL